MNSRGFSASVMFLICSVVVVVCGRIVCCSVSGCWCIYCFQSFVHHMVSRRSCLFVFFFCILKDVVRALYMFVESSWDNALELATR